MSVIRDPLLSIVPKILVYHFLPAKSDTQQITEFCTIYTSSNQEVQQTLTKIGKILAALTTIITSHIYFFD